MHENDLAVTAKNDAKNKLEMFVFDTRREASENTVGVDDEETLDKLRSLLVSAENWVKQRRKWGCNLSKKRNFQDLRRRRDGRCCCDSSKAGIDQGGSSGHCTQAVRAVAEEGGEGSRGPYCEHAGSDCPEWREKEQGALASV